MTFLITPVDCRVQLGFQEPYQFTRRKEFSVPRIEAVRRPRLFETNGLVSLMSFENHRGEYFNRNASGFGSNDHRCLMKHRDIRLTIRNRSRFVLYIDVGPFKPPPARKVNRCVRQLLHLPSCRRDDVVQLWPLVQNVLGQFLVIQRNTLKLWSCLAQSQSEFIESHGRFSKIERISSAILLRGRSATKPSAQLTMNTRR